MKTVGFKLLMPHDIVFIFENEVSVSQLPAFSMEQRRNLYLVYKEALHNVAKHSEATHAQVRIFEENKAIHIRISDDGKGFDSQQIQEGNGLKNFQKRAEEGGFEVNVSSRKGTIVEILVNNNPI
jgi:signal transduction histidine kinase